MAAVFGILCRISCKRLFTVLADKSDLPFPIGMFPVRVPPCSAAGIRAETATAVYLCLALRTHAFCLLVRIVCWKRMPSAKRLDGVFRQPQHLCDPNISIAFLPKTLYFISLHCVPPVSQSTLFCSDRGDDNVPPPNTRKTVSQSQPSMMLLMQFSNIVRIPSQPDHSPQWHASHSQRWRSIRRKYR